LLVLEFLVVTVTVVNVLCDHYAMTVTIALFLS